MKSVFIASSLLLIGGMMHADIIPSPAGAPSLNKTVGRNSLPFSSSGKLHNVPEPATFLLLGTGLIGLGFLRRKA